MENLIELIKSKLTIKSRWLILIASLYFGTVLNISFWRYVVVNIDITSFRVALFAISLLFFIMVPLYLTFNILLVPYLTKPILTIFLLISSGTNYFMTKYGILIDSDMIRNAFETNTREAFDLMSSSMLLWVLLMGVLPSVLLWFTKIKYSSFKYELKVRIISMLASIGVIAIFAATSFKEYASFGRNNRHVRRMINTLNYNYATVRYFQSRALTKREFIRLDENAKIVTNEEPIITVFVLIIGETARAKNFSLNGYERDTNPLLSKQDIVYFPDTASCGTATAVSLPCMFSIEGRKEFDVNDAKFTENLVDLLQKAGYKVLWRENDDGCKGICSRVPSENMVTLNNPKFCFDKYCHDEALLDGLEEKIRSALSDTVIVLHTMGSHGPTYYNRYPDRFKVFTPTCDTADLDRCNREQIINTYDNTILYTDYIISSTIDILKKFPKYETGLLYVSDHGESLGESNIYLHGLPYAIAPDEQKEVPMLMWMSKNMQKFDHIDYKCMEQESKKNIYSHDNLFHSIIGLLEVKTKVYDEDLDMFKNCRTKYLPHLE